MSSVLRGRGCGLRQTEAVEEIVASAPGRCGIIGNPSDIYGGYLVSCSVPVRATCRLVPGGSQRPEDLRLWNAATKRLPLEGYGVEWSTEIPRSSGISGSTALLAATLACVLRATGDEPDLLDGKAEFAELLRDIELRDAEITCGYQDAYMITFGGLNAIDFAGKHPLEGGPVARVQAIDWPGLFPQPPSAGSGERGSDLPFLLITTGVERLSGSVHRPMVERWLAGDSEVVGNMNQIAELGREGHKTLVSKDWLRLGELMAENQRLTASMGGSGPEVDSLVKTCAEQGALGAKLAGAGLGGTVLALTGDPDILEAKLREGGYTRFLRPTVVPGVRFEP